MTVSNDLGQEYKNDENREIWAATLWQMCEALGREVVDKIIVDSHFELKTHTNFKHDVRAIIQTEETLSGEVNYRKLAQIFIERKINVCGEIQTA